MADYPFTSSLAIIFAVADQQGSGDVVTICRIPCVFDDLQHGTQKQNIITAFKLPPLHVMSEENDHRVDMVHCLTLWEFPKRGLLAKRKMAQYHCLS